MDNFNQADVDRAVKVMLSAFAKAFTINTDTSMGFDVTHNQPNLKLLHMAQLQMAGQTIAYKSIAETKGVGVGAHLQKEMEKMIAYSVECIKKTAEKSKGAQDGKSNS